MNNEGRIKIVEAMNKTGMGIIVAKGDAYADGDKDTLSNFKHVSERGGTTVIQAWLNYYLKHEIAIELAIKKNPETPIEGTEGILSRIVDAKNYLDLLACILVEKGMLEVAADGTVIDLVKNPKTVTFHNGTGSSSYRFSVPIPNVGAYGAAEETKQAIKEEFSPTVK